MVYMNVLVMYRNNVLCLLYVIFFFHVCKFKALFKKVFQSSSSCSKMIIFSVDFFFAITSYIYFILLVTSSDFS